MCRDYNSSAEEALQSNNLLAEKRVALRAGFERAKQLQKHHLLTWARESSRALTAEAQQRARMTDKIEAANKAVQCLDTALEIYPDEPELSASRRAVGEYIGSVKVAHWIEMAERAAFKGHYRRAIERYKDALFYLQRETINEDVRHAGEKKIGDEIEALQTRIRISGKQATVEDERKGGAVGEQ
jgi:tetratricopeptide (TPR) repeat protein